MPKKKQMMTNKTLNVRWGVVFLIVLCTLLSRLVAPATGINELYNFSPLGATALFGAAYFSRPWMAFAAPLLSLWLSNLLLDNLFFSQYYDGFSWFSNWEVYAAFALIIVLGKYLLVKVSVARVLAASLSSSALFFLLTNFAVWQSGTLYEPDSSGLFACYTAALPFFKNTLQSDLLFSGILFTAMEWARRSYPRLIMQSGE